MRTLTRLSMLPVTTILLLGAFTFHVSGSGVPESASCGNCETEVETYVIHYFGGGERYHCDGSQSSGCHPQPYNGPCFAYHIVCLLQEEDGADVDLAAVADRLETAYVDGDVQTMVAELGKYSSYVKYIPERQAIQMLDCKQNSVLMHLQLTPTQAAIIEE